MLYIFLAGHDHCVLGIKNIKVVKLFILIQHGHYCPFSICLDPPFCPHLSKESANCFLVVLVSTYPYFGLLDLEKMRASLGLMRSLPYSCLKAINPPTCYLSPWYACCCILK